MFKKLTFNLFILTILLKSSCPLFAQGDSISYKNLNSFKFYSVSSSFERANDNEKYWINNKRVSREVYEKYSSNRDSFELCTPCLLKTYDMDEHLIREGIQYTDCPCGWFKEYYPNGKLKLKGFYRENPSGDWSGDSDDFCAIKVGQWVYFSERGDTLYSEFWDNGNFVKQVPQQQEMEVWKVSFVIDGRELKLQDSISAEELKKVVIVPHYKNDVREDLDLKIQLEVTAIGHPQIKYFSSVAAFPSFDLKQALVDEKFYKDEKISFAFKVLNHKEFFWVFYPRVSVELPERPAVQLSNPIIKTPRNTSFESDTTLRINENLSFYLVNSLTGKKTELKEGKSIALEYDDPEHDSLVSRKLVRLEGYLVNMDSTSLVFDVKAETITYDYLNGVESTVYVNYNNYLYFDEVKLRKIYLDELVSISYQKSSASFSMASGSTITFLSVLTGLIISPLVSINYKTKEFNTKRYYAMTKLSLFSLPVGITFMGLGADKYYEMTLKNKQNSKRYWYLESLQK